MHFLKTFVKRHVHSLILSVLLSSPSLAWAQNSIVTIPPGEDEIVSIRKGEVAPFSGQLFSPDTAIRWGFWLQQYKLRLSEDVNFEQNKCKLQLEFKDKELRIEKELYSTVRDDLFERLQKSEQHSLNWQDDAMNPPFYKTFEFGLVVGVILTGATALTVVLLAK